MTEFEDKGSPGIIDQPRGFKDISGVSFAIGEMQSGTVPQIGLFITLYHPDSPESTLTIPMTQDTALKLDDLLDELLSRLNEAHNAKDFS